MSDWADPPGDPKPAGDPGDELVEWVTADGSVIEVVTRRRMRDEGLCHRCTYVAVVAGPTDRFEPGPGRGAGPPSLDADDEIVVHRRADWKDVYPGFWDLAFGGVCGVGEDWAPSARRELAEEAGIALGPDQRLVELGPVTFDDPATDAAGPIVVGRVFLASWPGQPYSADGEAVEFARVRLGDLASWLDSRSVCPDSASLVAPALIDLLGPEA